MQGSRWPACFCETAGVSQSWGSDYISGHKQIRNIWINESCNKVSCRKNLQNFQDGVVLIGDLLLESIRRVLSLSCFTGAVRNLKLEFSRLEKTDAARGAAILMRNRLLRS